MTAEYDEDLDRLKVKAMTMESFDRILNDESDPLHAAAKRYNKEVGERLTKAYTQALARNHPEVLSNIQQATQAALEPMRAHMLSSMSDSYRGGVRPASKDRIPPFGPTGPAQGSPSTIEELAALRLAQEEATSQVLGELADQRDEAARRADVSDKRADEADRRARIASWVAYISVTVTVLGTVIGVAVSLLA